MRSIAEHACGARALSVAAVPDREALKKTYWLCIFAVNQHRVPCANVAL